MDGDVEGVRSAVGEDDTAGLADPQQPGDARTSLRDLPIHFDGLGIRAAPGRGT